MKYASLLVPGFSSAGQPVRARIESATRTGIPEFRISGIPPARARDMAERIQCAFQMSGLRPGHKNIVVHIEGNLDAYFLEELDLPVAACVLGALGYELHGTEEGSSYLGKLLLSGHIRPLPDLIRYLVAARMLGIESLLANGSEMDTRSLSAYYRLASPGKNGHGENSADPGRSMARGRIVLCLRDLLRFSTAPPPIQPEYSDFLKAKSHGRTDGEKAPDLVVDAVPERDAHSHGQILHSFLSLNSDGDSASLPYSRFVLRAAVAAAGARHSLLCLGPPGCGKTTLAGLIYALLPPMDESELKRIFLSSFYEIEGPGRIARPFRRPHHSATRVALVGGGTPVRAGEVTLANDGLLLLDELGEFRRDVLQALREPMDSGEVHISRGHHREALPARFWLVGTANGCPCGQLGSSRRCQCTAQMVRQYRVRMLGALQDRMSIELIMESENERCDLNSVETWYNSLIGIQEDRWRQEARKAEEGRNTHHTGRFNAELPVGRCQFAGLEAEKRFQMETEGWTNRKRNGIRRLARSMADMSGAAEIQMEHMLEALRYAGLTESIVTSPENGKAPWQSD